MASSWQIVTPLYFCQFLANLEQSGHRILEAQSVKLRFSLNKVFVSQKLKTKLKSLKHSSHIVPLSKGTIFAKRSFCKKKEANISKIKRVSVLKGIFSEATYISVLMYRFLNFQHNSNEFQTPPKKIWVIPSHPTSTSKRTSTEPTQIRVNEL